MMEAPTPLADQVREHEYASRLDRIAIIEACGDEEQRIEEARMLVRQLAMHRVYDRFCKEQEAELFDRLWPLAYPAGDVDRPPVFGVGAKTTRGE